MQWLSNRKLKKKKLHHSFFSKTFAVQSVRPSSVIHTTSTCCLNSFLQRQLQPLRAGKKFVQQILLVPQSSSERDHGLTKSYLLVNVVVGDQVSPYVTLKLTYFIFGHSTLLRSPCCFQYIGRLVFRSTVLTAIPDKI